MVLVKIGKCVGFCEYSYRLSEQIILTEIQQPEEADRNPFSLVGERNRRDQPINNTRDQATTPPHRY